ncbi:hypothetical protein GCM10022253_16430 [Sphingomonas endophytica]|uniref:Transcriptional regulator with XRE-family HTH domain n=1 Tax=Sphingomonas endophytica TaxID=869719 RepID=A0ABR6N4H5_9SPHN|nr:transcriptional regulator with XRE-family HTH domain [Sphingomonas endophytica]
MKTGRNATSRSGDPAATEIDRYRLIVFPNRVREHRKHHGYPTLLALAAELPAMAYIRLSKIERGEVVAKPDELRQIAAVLHVDPAALLLDVDAPDFDIAAWATDLQGMTPAEVEEDRFAVLLAAAIRARRDADRSLSIAQIERSYGLAPVILSRFENGYKPLARWNAQAVRAVCALLGAADVADLRAKVQRAHQEHLLDPYIPMIAGVAARQDKTRARIAALRRDLDSAPAPATATRPRRVIAPPAAHEPDPAVLAAIHAADVATVRMAPVFGAPLPDGLIERVPLGRSVEVPRQGGANSYGLRVCRATLGAALPAQAIAIVDPDRFPSAGGLAVLREPEGLRLVIVTFDRQGRMIGYSLHPEREILLDERDPAEVAMVIAALFDGAGHDQ